MKSGADIFLGVIANQAKISELLSFKPHRKALLLFCYILTKISNNAADFSWKGNSIHLEPGQMILERKYACERLDLSLGEYRSAIKCLENSNLIKADRWPLGFVVTVTALADYKCSLEKK